MAKVTPFHQLEIKVLTFVTIMGYFTRLSNEVLSLSEVLIAPITVLAFLSHTALSSPRWKNLKIFRKTRCIYYAKYYGGGGKREEVALKTS